MILSSAIPPYNNNSMTVIPQQSTYQPTYQPPLPIMKSGGVELSELCSSIVRILCGGDISWDMDRQMNFSIFCNRLLMQMNVPAPVVYTGLKYFQYILASSVNEYNVIDLSDIAHEYSLLTVSLELAYKFLEDNPPYMSQWSFASMIPTKELISLEAIVLNRLEYSLNISTSEFYQWTEQCNTLFDIPFISSLDQLLNMFDLHMTNTTVGYVTLLPVLLNDNIYNVVTPLLLSSLLLSSSTTISPPALVSLSSSQNTPISISDYFLENGLPNMCNQQINDNNYLLHQPDNNILYPSTTTTTIPTQLFDYNNQYSNQYSTTNTLLDCSSVYPNIMDYSNNLWYSTQQTAIFL